MSWRSGLASLLTVLYITTGCAVAASQPQTVRPIIPSPTTRLLSPTPKASSTAVIQALEPEPVLSAQQELSRLLANGDWAGLEGRLSREVALSEHLISSEVEVLSREQALAWLRDRWQTGIRVLGAGEVPHYGLVQFETSQWRAVPPSRGQLLFGVHRYDGKDRPAFDGAWYIDGIVYGD